MFRKNDIKIRQQPEKCIRVSWSENINKKFPILIQIFLTNEKETILKIIETISNMDSYLEKIDGEYSNLNGYFSIRAILKVQNNQHLDKILYGLNEIKSVSKAERV